MPVTEAISFLLNESPLIDRAIAHFGLTDDPSEAGYILPDGRMLDLSGKNDGGNPEVRALDHRDIGILYVGDMSISGTEAMVEFMQQIGAVRYSNMTGDIVASAAVKMSASQIDILTRTSKVGSYLVFDLDLQIGNKSEFDLVIDPIENHAQVRTALVDINKRFGGR